MKIFIDSADIKEINNYFEKNIISGITTNQTLIANLCSDYFQFIKELCLQVPQIDISISTCNNDAKLMIAEGEKIATLAKHAIIKLPMTWEGLEACKYLSAQGIGVNMTLCFTQAQALLAAQCGAKYVSLFLGRLDDNGGNGQKLVEDVRQIFDRYLIKTKILAASIRSTDHFIQSALAGADCITMSPKLINDLVFHDLTNQGLDIFNQHLQKIRHTI